MCVLSSRRFYGLFEQILRAALPSAEKALEEGDVVRVGGVQLRVLHTPGHSPGSITLVASDADQVARLALTGDTVFPGSCGRLDLPGSDARVMCDSLRRLAALPESLVIFPGHGYNGASSTIGAEKRTGLLRPMTREQWDRSMVR